MKRETEKRVYSLDVLRVIGMVMIVLHHYQQVTDAYFTHFIAIRRFSIVVEFFFVLSGFLAFAQVSEKTTNFKTYIKAKYLRLMPMVIISSFAYEVLLAVYNVVCNTDWVLGNNVSVWGVVLNATGMSHGWVFESTGTNNPVWYVSVLLLCYIILYFLVYVSKTKNIPVTYLFVMMVLLGIAIQTHEWEICFLNCHTARGYIAFFSGVLLAKWLNGREIHRKWAVSALAIVVLTVCGIKGHYQLLIPGFEYMMTFVFFPALIVLFLTKPVRKVFDFRLWGLLGAASYDSYLWHLPMMLAMYIVFELCSVNLNLKYYTCAIWFIVGTVLVGVISHLLIDRPIQKWLRRLVR